MVGGGWPTGFQCQPQSPLGLIGIETGLDWVGIGHWVWGDWGLRGWGLGLDNLDTFTRFVCGNVNKGHSSYCLSKD